MIFHNIRLQIKNPALWSPREQLAGLLFLAFLILVMRLPTFGEAFERDIMTYMVIADGLLHSQHLYVDLMEFRPPAVFWTYALFIKLFGETPLAIFMMGLTCSWLTLWGCYIAGRNISGSGGGLFAAAIWTVINSDLLLQANQPNTEAFINAALVWAFALLAGAKPNYKQTKRFIVIGLLYGLASLFKQISLPITVMVFASYILLAPRQAKYQEGSPNSVWTMQLNTLQQAFWAALMVVSSWVLVIGYFQLLGDFPAFKEALVDTGRGYAGDIWGNIWGFLSNPLIFVPKGGSSFFVPLVWLVVVLAIIYFWRDQKWQLGLWLAYFAGSLVAIALPGKFFPHYFQLSLPPLAIGTGCLLSQSLETKRKLVVGLLIVAIFPLGVLRLYQLTIPVEEVSFYKYGQGHGPEAVESKRIGLWIAQHLDPKVSVYQWGAEPGIYFWAKRPMLADGPPGFLVNSPFVERDTERLLQKLKSLHPGLIVANKLMLPADHPIVQWMVDNYVVLSPTPALEPPIERFMLLVPQESKQKLMETQK